MEELHNLDMKGKTLILVDYTKVYPPEYYIKKRGRKPSVTKFSLDKEHIDNIHKVIIDRVVTGRDVIDIDSKKVVTRVFYHEGTHTGSLKYEEAPTYLEIVPGTYIHDSLLPLKEQIIEKLNG